MRSHYYTPPPMPQGSIPPLRYTPQIAAVQAEESNLRPPSLLAIYAHHFYPDKQHDYRIVQTKIVTLIPPPALLEETPPLRNIEHHNLTNILAQHYDIVVPQPAVSPLLNPSLIPPPLDPSLLVYPPGAMHRRIVLSYYKRRADGFYGALNALLRDVYRGELPLTPPGRLVAFQPNAFQSTYPGEFYAFQTQERFISFIVDGQSTLEIDEFIHIIVGPLMKEYRRGTAVTFTAKTYDPLVAPSRLINPLGDVTVDLIDPDGISVLDDAELGRIATGTFRLTYQTTALNALGVYLIELQAVSGIHTAKTIRQAAFTLVD